MAVRTRKSTSTLPSEPVAEPAAAAPTRRRVPGTRAPTARRPATSSRTLRPIVPPEPAPEPAAAARTPEVTPTAEVAPVVVAAPALSAPAAREPVPEVTREVAAAVPVAIAAEAAVPELPAPMVATAIEISAPEVLASALVAFAATEIPAAAPPDEALPVAPVAEVPPPAAPPLDPVVGLPLMVEQLQADVRVLQGLVTGHTEQTVHELGRTTMQMVRMVTGVAHHLDQLAEQVQQLSVVAQTLAQALTRVEGTVATLQSRTHDQLRSAARGQRELHDVLSPVLGELVALRTQSARNVSMDRLDQFRMEVELKQLRQSVEKHGAPADLMSALPRPIRARPKR